MLMKLTAGVISPIFYKQFPHVDPKSTLHTLNQWFPNFSDAQTNWNNLVVREAQNIDLHRDSHTTSANLADH